VTLCISSQIYLLANLPGVQPGDFTDNSHETLKNGMKFSMNMTILECLQHMHSRTCQDCQVKIKMMKIKYMLNNNCCNGGQILLEVSWYNNLQVLNAKSSPTWVSDVSLSSNQLRQRHLPSSQPSWSTCLNPRP
jgi:hypothetical protein